MRLRASRAFAACIPFMLYTIIYFVLGRLYVLDITNANILFLGAACIFSYRGAILLFFHEKKNPGFIWFGYGIILMSFGAVINALNSVLNRQLFGYSPDTPFTLLTKVLFVSAFGALFLFPGAVNSRISIKRWYWLFSLVFISGALATLGDMYMRGFHHLLRFWGIIS